LSTSCKRRPKRKFIHTTDSKHDLPIAPNVLARQFNPAAPNLAYVSDITYVRTGAGWLYLAVVIDLFSRKVVGWAMAPSMPAKRKRSTNSSLVPWRSRHDIGLSTPAM
jgi:transposase InsO family protein